LKDHKQYLLKLLLALVLTTALLSTGAMAGTASDYAGKTVSILGDSISTYTGVCNDASANTTIGNNAIFYTPGKLGVYRTDTWWQQTVDVLDMKLLVNNAWSGSAIHAKRNGAEAAYKDRCVQLHNDITNTDPDVIVSFLGTNDFSWYTESKWGTVSAIDFDTLIVKGSGGTYTYATPSTVFEAYAIMLHKMTERYPDAEIYVMGLITRRDPVLPSNYVDNGQPTAINAGIRTLVERMGCTYVDLESRIPSAGEEFDKYIGDQKVHPGPLGHDVLTSALLTAMLGEETKIYTVSNDLRSVATDNDTAIVLSGGSYTATLTPAEGYGDVSVTVKMGGADVTADCYKDGVVSIDAVTGDIEITSTGTAAFTGKYRWEMNAAKNALVSVTTGGYTENGLTLNAGSISGGVLSDVRYALSDSVLLLPTEEWAIEWKASGNWRGLLLTTNDANTAGMNYLYHSESANLFALGTYTGSWGNYGVVLPEDIDLAEMHTFRVENRVENGHNMAYFVVDDMEIGALNNYYSGTSNQNKTVDWVDGQTFKFNYMGKEENNHDLTMTLEYLEIRAGGSEAHKHAYTITQNKAPTCAQDGLVTYTCSTCGHSYDVVTKADEDDHVFGAWLEMGGKLYRSCSICGKIESKEMLAYRWEMNAAGTALTSVTTNGNTSNPLTKTNGTVSGGVLNQACFAIEDTVTLLPDEEWVIEWKASGNWHGLLLCTNNANTSGMNYLYRNKNVPFMALGEYKGSTWYNYAITDPADTISHHVYRVENRVAADGTNTAYYLIDGVEVGALTTYYKSATNQNTNVNWINGQTLTFNHMGKTANSHYLSMDLDYLQIWTNGEPETLSGAINELSASGGGVFKLPCDVTESTVRLTGGVTLDLAGRKLTANVFAAIKGCHVVDSSAGDTGRLVCANPIISATNSDFPILSDTGYLFTTVTKMNQTGSGDGSKYTYIFLPKFAGGADALGAKGTASGVEFKLVLRWDGGEKVLTYTDEMIKDVYANNRAFYAWITNYAGYVEQNLSITVTVTSRGVTVTGEPWAIA